VDEQTASKPGAATGGPGVSTSGTRRPRTGRSAALVAIGILCSRLAGLVRQRVFAHYFGQGDAADAFNQASRIPNVLQNLLGEGALSASFIPVYASLLARGDEREASRVAGAIAAILALVTAVLVLVGMLATPFLIALIAPGFSGEKRELTIALVRILFPGIGLLVLSAWCLGILNSHHRFLLSYTAPVLWNLAMIVALLGFGGWTRERLAVALAWGYVAGSALQFLVQVPVVRRLAPDLRIAFDTTSEHVRTVLRNFAPVSVSRGVVQLSSYIDSVIASWLPAGSVTAFTNAQLIYTLPVSLFGMSVSAAELPAMSGTATVDGYDALRGRLDRGLRQIAFFVVPSAMAFLAFGDVIAAALLQTGRFTHADAVWVWGIVAGSSVGLVAQTLGRLYSSTYYALRDTRTPLRYAVLRVALTTILGYLAAIVLPPLAGIDRQWGTAGLTASAGVAGWLEFVLLRRNMNARIGRTGLPASLVVQLWFAAVIGAAVGWAIKLALPPMHPIVVAGFVLVPYGAVYLGLTMATGVAEARSALTRVTSRRRASSSR
jgi:putative peptidoglycan lipid II flippase